MKFYVSGESYRKLKNVFININSFKIIDVDWLIENSGLKIDNIVDGYLLNAEIIKMINDGVKSKRCNGILYINSSINSELVLSLKDVLNKIPEYDFGDIIILDDYDVPKHQKIYKLFDEVVFFPMYKKTKLIECKSFKFNK